MRASFLVATSLSMAATAVAAHVPKDVWSPLTKPGAKWTLPSLNSPDKLTIKVEDVRKVSDTDVVRLKWSTLRSDAAYTHDLPGQLAFTTKGVYFFDEDAKESTISQALTGKPTFAMTPKSAKAFSRKDGLFSFVAAGRAGTLCVGVGAEKPAAGEPGCGSSPCYQWLCLDATGIVGAGGLGDGEDYGFKPKIPGDGPK